MNDKKMLYIKQNGECYIDKDCKWKDCKWGNKDKEKLENIYKMAQIALGKQITLSCTEYAIKEGLFDNFIALHNAGYREISEDSVVVKKSVLKEELRNPEIQARKKTTEEFAKLVYSTLTNEIVWRIMRNWWLENGECYPLKDLLKELSKQYEMGWNNE